MSSQYTAIVHWRGMRVEVTYDYLPGCPEMGPSYASGGEPATAPEVDTHNAVIVDDDDNHIGTVFAALRSKFDAEVYDQLCTDAAEQRMPDPDRGRD